MNAVYSRLMGLGIALVFVGSTKALAAMGIEYAVEDCFVAALIATVLTVVAPSS